MMKSVLIAGCGYLGLRAAKAWVDDGIIVHAITRSSEKAERLRQLNVRPLILDLNDPPEKVDLPNSDVLLWAVGFERSKTADRHRLWIDGLSWLLNRLPTSVSRLIYTSSTGIYGQVNDVEVDESTTPRPVTEGGRCCLEAEQRVAAWSSSQAGTESVKRRSIVLRMAGIYGPDRLLRRIDDLRQQVALPGDGDHWLNLIHVDDAVRMVRYAATAEGPADTYNVANDPAVTREQYYQHLSSLAGTPPPSFGGSTASGRSRSANKRVGSRYPIGDFADFQYDDVLAGLDHAFRNTAIKAADSQLWNA